MLFSNSIEPVSAVLDEEDATLKRSLLNSRSRARRSAERTTGLSFGGTQLLRSYTLGLAISPDGNYLASGKLHHSTLLFDLRTFSEVRHHFSQDGGDGNHYTVSYNLDFSPDSQKLMGTMNGRKQNRAPEIRGIAIKDGSFYSQVCGPLICPGGSLQTGPITKSGRDTGYLHF